MAGLGRRIRLGAALTAGASAAWMVIAPAPMSWGAKPRRLAVVALDVGQGDATLVRLPSGRSLLVDAGGLGGGARFDVGERVVVPAAWALGVRRLDAFVATHGDVDHVGGAAAAAAMLRPREVWEGVPVADDPDMARLAAAASRERIAWRTLQAGDVWRDDGVIVRALHPPLAAWERRRVRNDDSVVLEVRFGEVSVVLAGDAGAAVEPSIAAQLEPARLRVLKLGHHGSAGSSSSAFVDAFRPTVAIASCGRGNRYGHPAAAVVRRLYAAGAALFRTDRDGAVFVETDGHELAVRTLAGTEARFRADRPAAPSGRPVVSPDVPRATGLAGKVEVWIRSTWTGREPRIP